MIGADTFYYLILLESYPNLFSFIYKIFSKTGPFIVLLRLFPVFNRIELSAFM